ncbi:MAG: DUF6893 family small protein [Ktedonobacterales bacterium]
MSRTTTRSILVTALLALVSLGVLLVVQNLPDIKREIKIYMM